MGRLLPSPCKVCGSPNHWDKEYPNWSIYWETRNQSAHFTVGQSDEDGDLEERYGAAYAVLLNNRVSDQLLELNKLSPFTTEQDFHEEAVMSLVQQLNHHSHGNKTYACKRTSVVEFLDKDKENDRLKPKLEGVTHIIEHVIEEVAPLLSSAKHSSQEAFVMEIEDDEDETACCKPKTVFMEATDGTILETEVKAYIVPGMTVSILLGKDYYLTYEISVSRSSGSYNSYDIHKANVSTEIYCSQGNL